MKKHQAWTPSSENIFGPSAWIYLPKVLNKRKITIEMLQKLRLRNHPDILHLLIWAVLEPQSRFTSSKKTQQQKARWFLKRHPIYASLNMGFWFKELNTAIGSTMDWGPALEKKVAELIEDNGLYQTDEGVKARLSGKFSYDRQDEYNWELEQWKRVECPHCDAEEIVRYGVEGPVNNIQYLMDECSKFTHVSGPYCKCDECERISRLTVEDADEMPYNTEYGEDQWDQYKEHLCSLVEDLEANAEKHGLPKPDRLMITARNVDWRGRTGYKTIRVDGNELADAMTVNSEFLIRDGELWLNEDGTGQLNCVMAHHDSMGAPITAMPAWECQLDNGYEEYYIPGPDLEEAKARAEVARILLRGRHALMPYTPDAQLDIVSQEGLKDALDHLENQLAVDCEPEEATVRDALSDVLSSLIIRLATAINNSRDITTWSNEAKFIRMHLEVLMREVEE